MAGFSGGRHRTGDLDALALAARGHAQHLGEFLKRARLVVRPSLPGDEWHPGNAFPPHQNGCHARRDGRLDVFNRRVADHRRSVGPDAQIGESPFHDRRMGLSPAHVLSRKDRIEEAVDAVIGELAAQHGAADRPVCHDRQFRPG